MDLLGERLVGACDPAIERRRQVAAWRVLEQIVGARCPEPAPAHEARKP
jgi:hypothetical protein